MRFPTGCTTASAMCLPILLQDLGSTVGIVEVMWMTSVSVQPKHADQGRTNCGRGRAVSSWNRSRRCSTPESLITSTLEGKEEWVWVSCSLDWDRSKKRRMTPLGRRFGQQERISWLAIQCKAASTNRPPSVVELMTTPRIRPVVHQPPSSQLQETNSVRTQERAAATPWP